ncbi:hypothetical protein O181_073627 [Austropuccinia psidii MF-1]|uniref:Retroviral polymerase SH3-like domain-containing protein n=1 Tax=Austropuccinia psidii MF-1 TaxID=1389203 RepID=A0A9Q3FBJ7_9BASI|nr:hypothetical protein [Austropuccinia psidii MF-1]
MEKAHCLMNHSNFPNQYWAEVAVIHNLKRQWDWKLAPHGQKGVLFGFENGNTAYRVLRLSDLKVVVTRNATFKERIFPTVEGGTKSPLWNIEDEQTNKDSNLLMELINSLSSVNSENNQYSDCLEDTTDEDYADSSSAFNSPLPNNNPSNHEEPSDQQQ